MLLIVFQNNFQVLTQLFPTFFFFTLSRVSHISFANFIIQTRLHSDHHRQGNQTNEKCNPSSRDGIQIPS
jgi:nucleoside-specific outer membrane channel protein Tsx